MRSAILLLSVGLAVAQQPNVELPIVKPGKAPGQPPSDAIVLFDGKSMDAWTVRENRTGGWALIDGALVSTAKHENKEPTGTWDLLSRPTFTDAQIHLEFASPDMPGLKGQAKANSGVYLQGRYEVQVLDSYENPTYAKGSSASLYGQADPLVNASLPPTQWQTYDIVFHAPKCDAAGKTAAPGSLTMFHNGVLVHDNTPVTPRRTCDSTPGPLLLQDHYHPQAPGTPIRFRNIWMRPLSSLPSSTPAQAPAPKQ